MWRVLQLYGVQGQLGKQFKSSLKIARAAMSKERRERAASRTSGSEVGMCNFSMVV